MPVRCRVREVVSIAFFNSPPPDQIGRAAIPNSSFHSGTFNPRPPKIQRATAERGLEVSDHIVSIHARRKSSGRPWRWQPCDRWTWFQSTPAENPAGDWQGENDERYALEFQSTPAENPAGDDRGRDRLPGLSRFNPRPPKIQRATRWIGPVQNNGEVSIHARRKSSGRRGASDGDTPLSWFQSTPAENPAGDTFGGTSTWQHFKFQSTPAENPAGDPLCLRSQNGR